MRNVSQLALGLLTAAGSSLIVLAAFALALLEGGIPQVTPQVTSSTATPRVVILTPAGGVTMQPSQTPLSSANTPATGCTPPENWQPYIIEAGDTLATIAARVGVTAKKLYQANCMLTDVLVNGSILYVPAPVPTNAAATDQPTQIPCGEPSNWVIYTVQPGDTLFGLSLQLGVSTDDLQRANCMTGVSLMAGQPLYVPFIPQARATTTPVSTLSPTPGPSGTSTNTQEPPIVTPTPTSTLPEKPGPTNTPTETLTTQPPANTETPTPTPTFPVEPSSTSTPTSAPTATPQPTFTNTAAAAAWLPTYAKTPAR